MFDNILKTKNALKTIKTRTQKNRETRIFFKKVSPCFGQKCKIWPYFNFSQTLHIFGHVSIFRKIHQKNVFDNILEKNNCFQDYKNKKLKKSKIGIFPRG